jgi:hypothetical protein
MVRRTLASAAMSSPAADLHRFLPCPVHVPLRPPAWDQEPSAHRTTVPPSAMSRFQSPTQGCPSHSRFPAHPASASATSSAGISFPPFIATSHVDGNPENAHSVAGNRTTGLGPRAGRTPGFERKARAIHCPALRVSLTPSGASRERVSRTNAYCNARSRAHGSSVRSQVVLPYSEQRYGNVVITCRLDPEPPRS